MSQSKEWNFSLIFLQGFPYYLGAYGAHFNSFFLQTLMHMINLLRENNLQSLTGNIRSSAYDDIIKDMQVTLTASGHKFPLEKEMTRKI